MRKDIHCYMTGRLLQSRFSGYWNIMDELVGTLQDGETLYYTLGDESNKILIICSEMDENGFVKVITDENKVLYFDENSYLRRSNKIRSRYVTFDDYNSVPWGWVTRRTQVNIIHYREPGDGIRHGFIRKSGSKLQFGIYDKGEIVMF